ncbi:MAG: 1-aminocyclopropane-1-carboxylate deaminase [Arcobacter sp.]|nr:MAG: 1-aminocyclopropane-1-carboxylate deaminase [Arcobacter sp.]
MFLSRIDTVKFRGRNFYIKRDDLLDTCLSGNKFRKLYTLLQTPSNKYTKIISYGGSQSNAMYALSCLCKQKGWTFHYYTKNLPQFLKDGAEGNLALSLENEMVLHELEHIHYDEKIQELKAIKEEGTLLVSQGGADLLAKEGVSILAKEINAWKEKKGIKDLDVVLPSGTGTTALYLQEALAKDIHLHTSVLVGDEAYQRLQWEKLSAGPYPEIFSHKDKKRFAKPYAEYLEIFKELQASTGIVFDLIYAPRTWLQLLENLDAKHENILYIHTGGVSGNETMLERYKHMQRRKR